MAWPQMRAISTIIRIAFLGGICILASYPIWSNQTVGPLPFKPVSPQAFIGLIAWLFAVSLFVERAVEVVVMVFRDKRADLLHEAEAGIARALENAAKTESALAVNATSSQEAKTAAADAAKVAQEALVDAHEKSLIYRAETKEVALFVGFVLGTLTSFAGVRALQGMLAESAAPSSVFSAIDILITGAMLAGGSEGIHRMANVFTSFMDSLSARADQSQRKS